MTKQLDPTTAYAEAVVASKLVTGKLVRLACERHLRDLQTARERGYVWSLDHALHALRWMFGNLKHSKGEWAGRAFELSPWQCFIVGSLFGWRRVVDGTRRFRTAHNEIARKNGKSTLAAGVGLYCMQSEQEPGAEIYCAATKKDQARIVFDEARNMVRQSPTLARRIKAYTSNLSDASLGAKMEPLGADSDTLDGLNAHCGIVDELHAHRNRMVWDLLETSMGARRQPLMFGITTAGSDRHSICWEQHTYADQVLSGVLEDDAFFAYIASLDEGDDWKDEALWTKGNPGLGVSVKIESLRRECEKAIALPGAQNTFKRLRLNVWTEQVTRWIDLDVWAKGGDPIDSASLRGRPCFAGLDLSATTDLSAWALLFPPMHPGERWKVRVRFFVPDENVRRRVERDRVPYDVWIRDGWIEATPGNVVDYAFIRARALEDAKLFDIQEAAYDRWNATQLVTELQDDGLTMVPFGQGFASMAAPCREFEKLIVGGELQHGGNPVLTWCAANVSASEDPAGNRKPDKSKSTGRIDGIVAMLMALGRAIVNEGSGPSVYEQRGLLRLVVED